MPFGEIFIQLSFHQGLLPNSNILHLDHLRKFTWNCGTAGQKESIQLFRWHGEYKTRKG